eukprot:749483-Hanusia_phi.AAC.3
MDSDIPIHHNHCAHLRHQNNSNLRSNTLTCTLDLHITIRQTATSPPSDHQQPLQHKSSTTESVAHTKTMQFFALNNVLVTCIFTPRWNSVSTPSGCHAE